MLGLKACATTNGWYVLFLSLPCKYSPGGLELCMYVDEDDSKLDCPLACVLNAGVTNLLFQAQALLLLSVDTFCPGCFLIVTECEAILTLVTDL